MDIVGTVRKLAKSDRYQCIYNNKELGLRLFENPVDISDIQLQLVRYLSFYSSIYLDIALGDITDIVLKDDIYEDAYMFYKSKSKPEKDIKNTKPQSGGAPTSHWIFKEPPKK